MLSQENLEEFYLFKNGPLYRLLQRLHLGDNPPALLMRRVLIFAALTWLPLLILSLLRPPAGGISLLEDVEVHVRFLVALPLLIYGENWINAQTSLVVQQFVESGIVGPNIIPDFKALVRRIKLFCNSAWGEGAVLLLTIFVLRPVWLDAAQWRSHSWFGEWENARLHLSPAGYWLAYVSMPVFQFILLRWIYRLLIWALFLWRVSRLDISINALHPDDMGGLNFLSESVRAMAPMLLTLSALASGTIASHIWYDGKDLLFYRADLAIIGAIALILTLGPLLVFCRPMREARLKALREFGSFAGKYVRSFSGKWIETGQQADGESLGNADIQSLADLSNSYNVVEAMRFAPIKLRDVVTVLVCTYVLVAPLLLTVIPAEQILKNIIAILL